MQRIGVHLCSAILALSATLGTLASVAALAEVEARTGLPVVVFPKVVVIASRPAVVVGQAGSAGAAVP